MTPGEAVPSARGLMAQAWRALRQVDTFAEGPSIFAASDEPRAFFVDGHQVVNLLDEQSLEVRLTRQVIRENRTRLKADPRVEMRRSGSDWVTVQVRASADIDLVTELATLAARAHLPPPGTTLRPPPSGADLARRRRFH
jgi:Family of unknown function (DUF5519)